MQAEGPGHESGPSVPAPGAGAGWDDQEAVR